jgi:hypothetical protein
MVCCFGIKMFHGTLTICFIFVASTGRIVSFNGLLLEHTWQLFIGRDHKYGVVKMASSA